jgi:hypothetical protein
MEHCFGTDSTISTSLIAVMPEHEIHKIYPPGVGSASVRVSCRPSFATISSSSLGRWRTMLDKGWIRGHTRWLISRTTSCIPAPSPLWAPRIRTIFRVRKHRFCVCHSTAEFTLSRPDLDRAPLRYAGKRSWCDATVPNLLTFRRAELPERPERSTTGPATCCAATTLPEELPYSGQTRSAPWRQVEAQN